MKTRLSKRQTIAFVTSMLVMVLSSYKPVEARRSLIEFDDSSLAENGGAWSSDTTHCAATDNVPAACRVNIFGDKTAGPIRLGFTIKIGTQNFNSFYVNEAGIITFKTGLPGGNFQPASTLAELQTLVPQPFIALFYRNLQIPDDLDNDPPSPFTSFDGGAAYDRGKADPLAPFNTAGLVKAIYISLREDSFDPTSVATEVMFYFTGNLSDADATNDGDFAFEMLYGRTDSDQYNSADTLQGVAGFSLGSGADSKSLPSPVAATNHFFFNFHDGHLVTQGTQSYTLTPTSGVDFGNQALLTNSPAHSFTLKNTGTSALPIGVVKIKGPNLSNFSFGSNNCGTSLSAGSSCAMGIVFQPKNVGAKTATLSVAAGSGTPAMRPLSGKGVKSVFTVAPASLSFGNVARNTSSAAKVLTIHNTGTVELPINMISLGGSNANQFSQTENCPASLSAGASCTVNVKFKPTSAGAKSASLIVTPGGGAAVQSIPLGGTGT